MCSSTFSGDRKGGFGKLFMTVLLVSLENGDYRSTEETTSASESLTGKYEISIIREATLTLQFQRNGVQVKGNGNPPAAKPR